MVEAILSQKARAISTLPKPNIITYPSSVSASTNTTQKKRAVSLSPTALVWLQSAKSQLHTPRPQALLKKRKLKKKKKPKRFWFVFMGEFIFVTI
jgi:hypothetical protein